jgi:hypothetical protein
LLELRLVEPSALEDLPLGLKSPDVRLLGGYLLARGLLDRTQLEHAIREQTLRRLFHLFDRRETVAVLRAGDGGMPSVRPVLVDIRPVLAYGIVIRSSADRRRKLEERLRGRSVRMIVPYDEHKNAYRLPRRILEAIRCLSGEGIEASSSPVLPGLDPMTTLGALLLLDRTSLLEIGAPDV